MLLAARSLAAPRGFVQPSVDQILDALDVSRSRAYEIKDAIFALLPTLVRPPGRPRLEHERAPSSTLADLRVQALRFVMQHPGCVQSGARARYSERYRRFVLELRERHADVTRRSAA